MSNRTFPILLGLFFKTSLSAKQGSWCESFHMKMSSACSFIFMQIKVIFIRIVSHLDSLWNRGTRRLANGLFPLGEVLAGNHGLVAVFTIQSAKVHDYNYHDSLRAFLIVGTGLFWSRKSLVSVTCAGVFIWENMHLSYLETEISGSLLIWTHHWFAA